MDTDRVVSLGKLTSIWVDFNGEYVMPDEFVYIIENVSEPKWDIYSENGIGIYLGVTVDNLDKFVTVIKEDCKLLNLICTTRKYCERS